MCNCRLAPARPRSKFPASPRLWTPPPHNCKPITMTRMSQDLGLDFERHGRGCSESLFVEPRRLKRQCDGGWGRVHQLEVSVRVTITSLSKAWTITTRPLPGALITVPNEAVARLHPDLKPVQLRLRSLLGRSVQHHRQERHQHLPRFGLRILQKPQP